MVNIFRLQGYKYYHGDPIKTRGLSIGKMKPPPKIFNGYEQ